jgi:hypothetical protein
MTAIVDLTADTPQTHALIIGAGAYTHLLGGAPGKVLDDPLGLEQLTTTTISARHFAGWVLARHFDPAAKDGLHNPDAPLGSVELLLSEKLEAPSDPYILPNGESMPVENATIQNILDACRRWRKRCDRHRNNVALFYFCGHGVAKGETVLLAEDFGANEFQPFEGALNFDRMRLGMDTCAARTQCYFVDSCRNVPFQLMNSFNVDARTPFASDIGADVPNALILYATSHNRTATGFANDVTLFTAVLLDALNGRGSAKRNGQWVVSTNLFGGAVRELMQRRDDAVVQDCDCQIFGPGPGIFHLPSQPPLVPVTLQCAPPAATAHAELSYRHRKKPTIADRRALAEAPWQLMLESGAYEVNAHFPNRGFQDFEDVILIEPPFSDEPLAIEEAE